jgi:hypothetical protein
MSPLMSTMPAVFAKSSMLWSSLFFIFSNSQFKNKVNLSLFTRRPHRVEQSHASGSVNVLQLVAARRGTVGNINGSLVD